MSRVMVGSSRRYPLRRWKGAANGNVYSPEPGSSNPGHGWYCRRNRRRGMGLLSNISLCPDAAHHPTVRAGTDGPGHPAEHATVDGPPLRQRPELPEHGRRLPYLADAGQSLGVVGINVFHSQTDCRGAERPGARLRWSHLARHLGPVRPLSATAAMSGPVVSFDTEGYGLRVEAGDIRAPIAGGGTAGRRRFL